VSPERVLGHHAQARLDVAPVEVADLLAEALFEIPEGYKVEKK